MQEPSRPLIEAQKLRRARRSRQSLIKGTAMLLLVVIGLTTLQQYFSPGAMVWLVGGVGLWLLVNAFTRHRPGQSKGATDADGSEQSGTFDPEAMESAEFLEHAINTLQSQGYETQVQNTPGGLTTYLLLVRGNERVKCLVANDTLKEEDVREAVTALQDSGCQQAMVLSPYQASSQVELFALQHEVVLIDQDELIRLRSLQVKGHRVHAFRPRAAHQTANRQRHRNGGS